jgi:hypothetical protein
MRVPSRSAEFIGHLLRTIEGVNELHQYKKELLEQCKNEAWPDMREGHRQITAGAISIRD